MVYIWDTIPSKILQKYSCPKDIECHFIDLIFRKGKWLLCGKYHKALDTYSNYEKVLLIGDFNTEITEHYMESLLYEHELSNSIVLEVSKIHVV